METFIQTQIRTYNIPIYKVYKCSMVKLAEKISSQDHHIVNTTPLRYKVNDNEDVLVVKYSFNNKILYTTSTCNNVITEYILAQKYHSTLYSKTVSPIITKNNSTRIITIHPNLHKNEYLNLYVVYTFNSCNHLHEMDLMKLHVQTSLGKWFAPLFLVYTCTKQKLFDILHNNGQYISLKECTITYSHVNVIEYTFFDNHLFYTLPRFTTIEGIYIIGINPPVLSEDDIFIYQIKCNTYNTLCDHCNNDSYVLFIAKHTTEKLHIKTYIIYT